jgi:magnesium transporter
MLLSVVFESLRQQRASDNKRIWLSIFVLLPRNSVIMQFELTKEFLEDLHTAIGENNSASVVELISKLHAADVADILEELDQDEARYIYDLLNEERAADVLIELDEDVREKFLSSLSTKEIAQTFIDNLDSDDAADVIAELPENRKDEVISYIEDAEQASDIVDLLTYEEGTAGALMAKELIRVEEDWTVVQCVREMRKQAEDVESVFTVYVTDSTEKLVGTLSLKRLLLTPARTLIKDIYNPKVISVKTSSTSEDVSRIMDKYDLVVLPVVNEIGRLMGRITIDDVVDVIKEEAEKDYQMASGHSEVVESGDNVWKITRARVPWLVVGLVGGIFGSKVIGFYESDIHIHPEMAFFIPLIAATGGNVGVQSSSIIVQGLANDTLGMDSIFNKLFKEFMVAMLVGVICSGLIFSYNYFFSDSWNLSVTVSCAMLSVIVFAALFGTLVPLMLDKYKIDPALATGPFITTVNDVLGLTIYFFIGRLMYM